MPEITEVNQIQRCHLEAFKEYLRWVLPNPNFHRPEGATLSVSAIAATICSLNLLVATVCLSVPRDAAYFA